MPREPTREARYLTQRSKDEHSRCELLFGLWVVFWGKLFIQRLFTQELSMGTSQPHEREGEREGRLRLIKFPSRVVTVL